MTQYRAVKDPDAFPKGTYQAHFINWEPRDGEHGEFIIWSFQVYHNDERQTVTGISSARFGTKTKEYGFVTALQGKAPEPGEDIDLEGLRGAPCMVELDVKEGKNGGQFNNVIGVHPAAVSADALAISEDDVPF